MDYTAVGQTTHVAARMEQMALPGSILLSADALARAEGYVEVTSLGPLPIGNSRLQHSGHHGVVETEAADLQTGARASLDLSSRAGVARHAAPVAAVHHLELSPGGDQEAGRRPQVHRGDLAGFFGVLHTRGRTLQYHPHIHYVVAGRALSSADGRWHPARPGFYLSVRALSRIFRAKFRDAIDKARSSRGDPRRGLLDGVERQLPSHGWRHRGGPVPRPLRLQGGDRGELNPPRR
jgi:hypothetical protein